MTVTVIGDNTGDDFAGTDDTYLNGGSKITNYGASTTLQFYDGSAGSNDRTILLSFPGLSNISASDIVSAATIGIYKTDTDSGTEITANHKKCLRNWVEAQATYNIYSTGNSWTTGGGLSDGNDRSPTTSLDLSIDGAIGYKTGSSAQLAADVEDFIDGTLSNYGWLIEGIDVTGAPFGVIGSSEGTDGQRPYLSVTHTAVGGLTVTMLPASLALTESAMSAELGLDVGLTSATIALTESVMSVERGLDVTLIPVSVALTESTMTVDLGLDVDLIPVSVAITEAVMDVELGTGIDLIPASIAITPSTMTVGLGLDVAMISTSIVITEATMSITGAVVDITGIELTNTTPVFALSRIATNDILLTNSTAQISLERQ